MITRAGMVAAAGLVYGIYTDSMLTYGAAGALFGVLLIYMLSTGDVA